MARRDEDIRITPSLLDRLIDMEPTASKDPPKSRFTGVQELKAGVRRDLEWLLNTRSHGDETVSEDAEVRRSVVFYGMPDILGLDPKTPAERKRLVKSLETAIRRFEPRFLDLKITLEPVDEIERQVKFRVEAKLDMEPAPEPIIFDTVIASGSGEFAVKER